MGLTAGVGALFGVSI